MLPIGGITMDYGKYLTYDILPFWLKHSLDKKEGGIITILDELGNVKGTEKNVWFVGRSLWAFSVAYRLIEQKGEYLDACKTIFSFLEKCTLLDGRLPFRAKRNGECIQSRGLYYSEGFAAIGCAQYYRICKDENVKKKAEQYFDIAYNQYKNPETKIPVPQGTPAYTSFGIEMFMLNVAQFVRNAGIRVKECNDLAQTAIYNMQNNGHIIDDLKTVREYIPTTEAKLLPPKDLYSCPGHVFEGAWFVMCEGVVKNNEDIKNFGIKLLNYAMPRGFEKYTSLIKTGFNDPEFDNYIWWPQCEAIIAYRLAYNITGKKEYLDISKQIEDFAFNHFADFKNGEWYTEISQNGEVVNRNKGTFIKGPFHLPRMLFALTSLDETNSIEKYMS